MQLVHHRHSLVLCGAGHVPASINHRFLVAAGIIPDNDGWVPAREALGAQEARVHYTSGLWLQVLPERATVCQDAPLPIGDPRELDLGELRDVVEGYYEAFPRLTHTALGVNVDLMIDADPQTALPDLLAEPGRWDREGLQPLGLQLSQRYRLPEAVLTVALGTAMVNPPPPAPPQPKVSVGANLQHDLAEGLSRAQLHRILERLPSYREIVLELVDQVLG